MTNYRILYSNNASLNLDNYIIAKKQFQTKIQNSLNNFFKTDNKKNKIKFHIVSNSSIDKFHINSHNPIEKSHNIHHFYRI